MTRPVLITQASGRYEDRLGSTLIRVRLGLSLYDRLFVILWLGVAASFFFLLRSSGGASFQENWMFQIFPVVIFGGVYVLVRLIALNDDEFEGTHDSSILDLAIPTDGTYYVRVRAQNAGGSSAASNESILVVGSTGCTTAPNAPASFAITASGSPISRAL